MRPERWQQIRDVLEKALELAPGERSAFLKRACSSDPSLRDEVETLLASSDDVRSSFLQSSAPRVTLAAGTRLGEYEVKTLVGAGGMGEVYRARDSRLGRDVAIKVLPSSLSGDPDRLRRFEQEARAAAALNHPNILAVFQMGTYEGAPYLVSELLEGETLREQIKRGRLSMRKAIDYGVQIARGLAAAHEKGIVHRDLKPENLFATKDGRVKILDFGLAKLMQPITSEQDGPTLTEGTEAGVVMGTVGYMAPEQVRGQATDHRADIFAFGAILYEMLAGKRAFQKPTSPETMSAILNEDPPGISQVTANIPPALQRVVHRCLEKNPEQRFQSASDLAFALDALSETSSASRAFPEKGGRRISEFWPIFAVLVAAVAVVLVLSFRTRPHPEPKHELVERQLTANPPENPISGAALSRDGKYLAYGDFSKKLSLLSIDGGELRQVPLPAPYRVVDWFPDGNHLLLNGGDLWKISTWDFGLRKLWGGHAWTAVLSPDGSQIAFVGEGRELWLMGADGEEPHKIFAVGAQEALTGMAWSPTGHRLAYIRHHPSTSEKTEATLETCDLAGGARTVVLSDPDLINLDGEAGIAWLPDGRIIYTKNSTAAESDLWAIRAEPAGGQPTGDTTRLAGWKNFAALAPQASADGKRLIAARQRTETGIYISDLATGNKGFTPRRFTLDDWYDWGPTWTEDSKAILFTSKRTGRWAIYEQKLDSRSSETLIAGPDSYSYPKLSAQGNVLYTARPASSTTDYRLMSTPEHGGARSTLMMGNYSYACGSLPSSSCVVAEIKDQQLIFSHLDPVRGRGVEIARIAGYQTGDPRWDLSPDGTRIALVDPSEGKGEVRILGVADRKVTVLPVKDWKWQFLSIISWAADGKTLFAQAQDSLSFALISIDTNGNPRVLQEVPAGSAWIADIVPSPDGRSLALTKRTYLDDVMLLENF
jgi:Tol biopolymer transport system component